MTPSALPFACALLLAAPAPAGIIYLSDQRSLTAEAAVARDGRSDSDGPYRLDRPAPGQSWTAFVAAQVAIPQVSARVRMDATTTLTGAGMFIAAHSQGASSRSGAVPDVFRAVATFSADLAFRIDPGFAAEGYALVQGRTISLTDSLGREIDALHLFRLEPGDYRLRSTVTAEFGNHEHLGDFLTFHLDIVPAPAGALAFAALPLALRRRRP